MSVVRRARRGVLAALAAVTGAAALTGCAGGPPVSDYAQELPVLDLKSYFNGPLKAHGVFTDRSGKVVKRFIVEMEGTWQGPVGTLDERFTYSDGTTQRRVWTLTDQGQGRWSGRADDVVGEAQGQAAGNAFHWRYTLRLPVDGREWEVQFSDWMFLMDNRVMLNRAEMSKWGIRLGEVTLAFTKP